MFAFMLVPCCFYCYISVVWLAVKSADTSRAFSMFRIILPDLGLLCFHIKFKVFISMKNSISIILVGFALNLQVAFHMVAIFIMVS